jgi:LysM repeat protein
MGLTKAWITNEDSQKRIECLFNPTEYTIAKSNEWKQTRVVGKNVPMLTFTGGQSRSLNLELFFDTLESGDDVRKHLNKLWKLVMIDEKNKNRATNRARPPLCTFHWGPNWSFQAAITSLSVRYTLFREDGTPVRATASVTFQEGRDDEVQAQTNATASEQSGQRVRTVQAKDNLPLIAQQEYGDASQWRPIADANNLDNPRDIKPGQQLVIPPKSNSPRRRSGALSRK